ncbi:MAG: TspO/MBR family protein [Candidatus Cyclobacteriaceae bacterium M3_2C_046]
MWHKLKKINYTKLITAILLSQLAGLIGSVFTLSSVNSWYANLEKPAFTPPNWLFGPVWTLLYLLMGIAAYLVWQKKIIHVPVKKALILFLIQLFLNALWSFAFFGLKSPLAGLIVIALLLIFLILTILQFFMISKPAGWLLIPYLLWVSYASALNLSIYILN